jgi:hypothetical protein
LLNLEKKVSLYIIFLLLFVSIIGSVLFGASVRHVLLTADSRLGVFGEVLLKIAAFPALVRQVVAGEDAQQITDDRFTNIDGFKKDGELPAGVLADEGYLLLSSYDADKEQPTVQLIQINTQETLHEWVPDIDYLNELNILSEEYSEDFTAASHFRLMNPLPINGTRLIFNNDSGLYGMNLCGKNDMFTNGTFHHSNQLDHEGNIWTPSVVYPHSFEQVDKFRDDAITKISPSGEVLFIKSVAEILVENGYRGLLAIGNSFEINGRDPIHLNDIQPALIDSEFWKKGDLLLSIRNRSTVMLYRPSINKILWLKTGSWMNQHDMNFVNDHTISIFGNNQVFNGQLYSDNYNSVYFYDFKTDKVSEPYLKIMKEMGVKTVSEGLATPLSGGDLFIDESNNGRILRVSTDEVKWEYVRRIDKETVAMSSWSRYLTSQEAEPMIEQLRRNLCK